MEPLDIENVIADILNMLSLSNSNSSLVTRITSIVNGTVQAISLRLGGIPVPEMLSYIVRDVAIARYNRIGSEGSTKHDVEGEGITFLKDDFLPYTNDLSSFLKMVNSKRGSGIVHFM